MKLKFTEKNIAEIESVLEIKFSKRGDQFRAVLENIEQNRKLTLEIYSEIPIGVRTGNLISVFTSSAHAQLHFCTGFVASDVLGEVVFIGELNGHLSGIIVEKAAACSIYSNVDASLLSSDFTKLEPEVMVSGVALSLAEHLLEENPDSN
ncbi:MAG: hypothetical protein KAS58_04575 [Calditrichia bacterium]|nr:hypothetical protein [Calditrichia bacterium]